MDENYVMSQLAGLARLSCNQKVTFCCAFSRFLLHLSIVPRLGN